MDLSKIRYFLAVGEHGSISDAAEALRISQPTLSRHIQSLGREFGVTLLTRNGRGVSITDAGQRLLEGLRGLDRQLRSVRVEVAEAGGQATGEVAFGIPPSPRTFLGIAVLSAFSQAHPNVVIRVTEETSGRVRDLVARGELDFALTNSLEPMGGLHVDVLATEPLLLVGPRGTALSMDCEVPIKDLADLPLIMTSPPNSLRSVLEMAMGSHGLRPLTRIEANTLPLMIDLVCADLGYTVLPACGVLPFLEREMVSAAPIAGIHVTWVVAYPNNRVLSRAAAAFARMLVDEARRLVRTGGWPLATIG
jgi:LysR family nitrogen assimilation transcriptional regulator